MTSKKLFINLLKDDGKKRSWLWALSALYFCLILPGVALDSMQAQSQFRQGENARIFYFNILSQNQEYPYFFWGVVILAAGCALSGFSYLHSKSKLDFYHSLPVKRAEFLSVQYVSSLLIFLLPTLIGLGEELLLGVLFGLTDMEYFRAAIGTEVVYFLIFCFTYQLCVTAMMLTGKILVSILAMGALFVGTSLMAWIYQMFRATFFETYYYKAVKSDFWDQPSPYTLIKETSEKWSSYVQSGFSDNPPGNFLILLGVGSFLLIFLNLWIYMERKTETAGRAIVSERAGKLIEFCVVVTSSLGVGIYLKLFSYTQSDLWFFGGIIIGGLIFTAVIDFVYSMDIKAIFKKPAWAASALLTSVVIALIFQLDLLGYDAYLPKKEQISSMSVANYNLSNVYQQVQYQGELESSSTVEVGSQRILDSYQMTEFEPIYQLAQNGRDYAENENQTEENRLAVDIRYNLKNGRSVYRTYWVDRDVFNECADELYTKPGFKRAMYPIFQEDVNQMLAVSANGLNMGSGYFYFESEDQKKQFADIYMEDLLSIKYHELRSEEVIGTLNISYRDKKDAGQSDEWMSREDSGYPLLRRFTDTLAFLEDMGIIISEHLDPDSVKELELWTDDYENMVNLLAVEPGKPDLITDGEKRELVEMLTYHYCLDANTSEKLCFLIAYGEGGTFLQSFQVPEKDLPDFMTRILDTVQEEKMEGLNFETVE